MSETPTRPIEPPRGTIEYDWSRVQGSAYGAEVHLGRLLDFTRTVKRGSGVSQHAVHLVGRRLIGEAHIKRGYVTEWKTIRELSGGYSERHARRIIRCLELAGVATGFPRSGKSGKFKVHPDVIYSLAQTGEKTAVSAEAARELAHLRSPVSLPGGVPAESAELPKWVPLPQPNSRVTRAEIFAAFVAIARLLGGEAVRDVPDAELGGERRRIHAIWSDRNFCPLDQLVDEVRQVTAAYLGGAGGVSWAKLRAAGKQPRSLLTRAYWLSNLKIARDWAAHQQRHQASRDAQAAARAGLTMPAAIDLEGPAAGADVDVDLFHELVWRRYCQGASLDHVWLLAQPQRVEGGFHVLAVDVEAWAHVVEALEALRALALQVGAIRLEPER